MASFAYSALHFYNASDNSLMFSDVGGGSTTDGEADATFEIGDTVDYNATDPTNGDAPFTATAEYIGFIDVVGLYLPIAFVPQSQLPGPPSLLQTNYPNGVYIIADPRDRDTISLRATLDVASIDSGPYAVCFLAGTAIATPEGSTAVEHLSIGDAILTADGRTVPVRWIGRQTVSTLFGAPKRLCPVRIAAGALGDGLPLRDLCLTADHALMIGGLLVNAGALVNGTTITREPLDRIDGSYTVYHVETEAHDVILAEGAPTETFVDYIGRRAFDNHAEYAALYGEDRTLPEMAQPRVTSPRMLPAALRARFGLVRAA